MQCWFHLLSLLLFHSIIVNFAEKPQVIPFEGPSYDVPSTPLLEDISEYYSDSNVGLLKLLEVERMYVQNLSDYVNALQQKVDTLQTYIQSLKHIKHKTLKEQEQYVTNPLNAFGLIRRLHEDWPLWQNYIMAPVGQDHLEAMNELLTKTPSMDDMDAALQAIYRIENTYDLGAADIASGRLQNKQYDIQLSKRDCLALADHKYRKGDHMRASLWYRMALRPVSELHDKIYDKILGSRSEKTKMMYVKSVLIYQSMIIHTTILKTSVNDTQLEQIADTAIAKAEPSKMEALKKMLLGFNEKELMDNMGVQKSPPTANELGCRGLFPKHTNLRCHYNFSTTPFLKLAPLKMEEINLDPYIVLYHDIVSDRELEDLHEQAVPWFETGFAGIPIVNQTVPRERVSRLAWLLDTSPNLDRVNRRIADMTGFDLSETLALQVSNFGLGGNFKPHYDYMSQNQVIYNDIKKLGDRAASVVIYSSNVELGGATVFPLSKVAVQPQKGSALFWFNLHDDGSPDPRSLHSVCPVIVGNRWTLVKWLHEFPQVFRRPCSKRTQ